MDEWNNCFRWIRWYNFADISLLLGSCTPRVIYNCWGPTKSHARTIRNENTGVDGVVEVGYSQGSTAIVILFVFVVQIANKGKQWAITPDERYPSFCCFCFGASKNQNQPSWCMQGTAQYSEHGLAFSSNLLGIPLLDHAIIASRLCWFYEELVVTVYITRS